MTLPNESSSLTRGEKTKYRLAESMKECMCHTPVDAITVRQITENCGLTRQTFYRNFMDKFDLINWYFDKLLIKSFEYMGQGKNGTGRVTVEILLYWGRKRIFPCRLPL